MEETAEGKKRKIMETSPGFGFWKWAVGAVLFRLILIYFPKNLYLASRPEVSTPVTSLRRFAEGYWLKQLSMSPYADLEGNRIIYYADSISAILLRRIGQRLQIAYDQNLRSLGLAELVQGSLPSGDIAALVYLWNPFTILTCVLYLWLLLVGSYHRICLYTLFFWLYR